ncbi:MAG: Hpt domain-containing protein [Deltaproteobacteria bacterium]|nr:MAG: Hpt domain-containing protein [Deltaproteobacteria bacterium]
MVKMPASPESWNTLPALDNTTLQDCTMGEPSLVEEILNLYKEDVPQRLERAEAALEQSNFSACHFEIHSIKGSSGSVGARQVEALAVLLIPHLKQENGAESEALLQQIRQAFDSFLACYRDIEQQGFQI